MFGKNTAILSSSLVIYGLNDGKRGWDRWQVVDSYQGVGGDRRWVLSHSFLLLVLLSFVLMSCLFFLSE